MYIGKLAELTGATRKAIRLYESLGLIPAPHRQGTYRVYSDNDVALVTMIRRAKEVGFSLAEMTELAAAKATSDRFPLDIAQRLIADKREKLKMEMDAIRQLVRSLAELERDLSLKFGSNADDS
jgi:DNA-binding transcriptional MerR regulator